MIGRRHDVRKKGYALIEVMIALAILGVGLVVVIELFSGGLRLARTSVEYTKAVNYARLKMEEMAIKPKVEEGIEEGEFDPTYRWQVEVKKVDLLSVEKDRNFKPPVDHFQVKVNVLWKSGLRDRSIGIESYQTIKVEGSEGKI